MEDQDGSEQPIRDTAASSSTPSPSQKHVEEQRPTARRIQRSPTPQSCPSSSPEQSRNPSRSPSTSKRSVKRTSTFSPVPEEQPSSLQNAQPAPKRARTAARTTHDPDAKRRGQRLFGVLTSTLSQFKRESETQRAASAAHKRAEVEARLASKLRDSERVIGKMERRREMVWEARRLAEQIASADAQRKTLRGLKRRMASFLFTDPTGGPGSRARKRAAGREERLAADIPTAVAPERARERDGYAVYFLPGKTLPEQEDALNAQEDDVDETIDRFDDTWDARRAQLVHQLDEVKRKLRESQ